MRQASPERGCRRSSLGESESCILVGARACGGCGANVYYNFKPSRSQSFTGALGSVDMAGKLSPSRSIAWSTYASIPQRSTSILLTRPSAPHNHDRQRCLHTTPHRRGGQRASWPYMEPPETGINAPQIRKGIEQFESKTKSQAVYAGEMMAEGEMPSDIGLLFGTLILDKTNKPSFSPFDSTSWAYQMNKLVKRVRELGSYVLRTSSILILALANIRLITD